MKLVKISTERACQGGKSSTHTCSQKAQVRALLASSTSLCFVWHKGLPSWCSPPAESMLTWTGARAAASWASRRCWLFLGYFGIHLCSFSGRAVGPPCLLPLGGPAPLSISRHIGFSLVVLDHMKILLVTHVVGQGMSPLHNYSLLVSLHLYHKVSNKS